MRNLKFIIATIALGLLASCVNAQTANYEQVKNKDVKGKLNTYESKRGAKFSVGDTLTYGSPIAGIYSFMNTTGSKPISGNTFVITKLIAYNRLIFVYGKGHGQNIYATNLQDAIDNNEIENDILTREEAIAKLIEAKDLLYIEMITEEEYTALKDKLTPIIKS